MTKKGRTKNNPQNPKRYYAFLCLRHVVHMIAMSQFLLSNINFFVKLIWIIKTFLKIWTFEVCSVLKSFCGNKGQGLECWCCKEGQLKRQMSHSSLGISISIKGRSIKLSQQKIGIISYNSLVRVGDVLVTFPLPKTLGPGLWHQCQLHDSFHYILVNFVPSL